jgi:hypothetical protein
MSDLVSSCLEKYSFIGTGVGIGKAGKKITYEDAWKGALICRPDRLC